VFEEGVSIFLDLHMLFSHSLPHFSSEVLSKKPPKGQNKCFPIFTSKLASDPHFWSCFLGAFWAIFGLFWARLEENELENDENIVSIPKKVFTHSLNTSLSGDKT
jgi:hypothetical protein